MAVNPIQQVLQSLMQGGGSGGANPIQQVLQMVQQNPQILTQLASLVPQLTESGPRFGSSGAAALGGNYDREPTDEEITVEKGMDREMRDPSGQLHPYMEPRQGLTPQIRDIIEMQQGREGYKPEREPMLEEYDPPDLTKILTPEMIHQFAAAGIRPQQFMQLASRTMPNVDTSNLMKGVYTDMVDPKQNVEPQSGLPGTSSVNPAASTVFESYRDQGAMQDLMRRMMQPKDPDDPDEESNEDEEDSEEPTS